MQRKWRSGQKQPGTLTFKPLDKSKVTRSFYHVIVKPLITIAEASTIIFLHFSKPQKRGEKAKGERIGGGGGCMENGVGKAKADLFQQIKFAFNSGFQGGKVDFQAFFR